MHANALTLWLLFWIHENDIAFMLNETILIPIPYYIHGRIIKWTQHIGFLTLTEIAQVIEGNHVNDSKRR